MILSLHHDRPESESSFERFHAASVLKGLKALDSRARRKGLDALDPARGALIPIGMEIENGRVVKNGYGVFDLPWQAEEHPEWPAKISAELDEIRAGIRAAHSAPIKFLIWAGMGGSAEDKAMYQAVGLAAPRPAPLPARFHRPREARFHPRRHEKAQRPFRRGYAAAHAGGGHGDGHDVV